MAKASTKLKEDNNNPGAGTAGGKPPTIPAKPAPGETVIPAGENPAKDTAKAPEPTPKPVPATESKALPVPGEKVLVNKGSPKFSGNFNALRKDLQTITYTMYAEANLTLEDVLAPSYWANVTKYLQPGYRVEVIFQGSDPRFVELYVVAKGQLWAKMKIIQNVSFAEEAQEALGLKMTEALGQNKVYFKGGPQKWVVERTKDSAIISDQHNSEADALRWDEQYRASLRK